MPRRNPTVPLLTLLNRRFPGLDDPALLIKQGAVLVNGVPAASPRTRVRADAAVRIRQPRLLRGTIKLAYQPGPSRPASDRRAGQPAHHGPVVSLHR